MGTRRTSAGLPGWRTGWCLGLRARRIGVDLLEIGWLTPDPRRNTAYGHQNPSLLLRAGAASNATFVDFFDRTFNELWDHSETEDGAAVLARLTP